MRFSRHILCFALLAVCFLPELPELRGQIRLVPREKLDSIVNPKLDSISKALHFDRTIIDAGQINEDDGIQTFQYGFTNISEETIEISRLSTNCSCVIATPQKRLVRPGEHASIKVAYRPEGHPGTFERTIRVYAKAVRPELADKSCDKERHQLAAFLKLEIKVSERLKQNR